MAKEIPARKDWVVFKKKYGVADGAAKNIKLGEVLDHYYHTPAHTLKEQEVLLTGLETSLHNYITTIDKKKVKQYPAFEKAFMDDYLGVAHTKKEDIKRYNANRATYQTELSKFFSAVQALSPNMNAKGVTTAHKKDELEKFKSGPVRGLSAVGKSVKGVDVREIDTSLGKINTAVQALPKDPTDEQIHKFIEGTLAIAEEIRVEAVKLGLVAPHVAQ